MSWVMCERIIRQMEILLDEVRAEQIMSEILETIPILIDLQMRMIVIFSDQ